MREGSVPERPVPERPASEPPAETARTGSPAAPFERYDVTVPAEWVDYNGHMHDASYVSALSDANEELFAALGLSADYRARTGASYYTVEYHVRYLAECALGARLRASTLVTHADPKRIRLRTELVREDGMVAATGESLYLHVDTAAGGVRPLPEARFAPVAAMRDAHAPLARRAAQPAAGGRG
jgi:acyl-CoA thioesterase FadM